MGGMPSLVEIRSSSGTNSQILFLDFVDLTFQMRMSATGKFSPHSFLFTLLPFSFFALLFPFSFAMQSCCCFKYCEHNELHNTSSAWAGVSYKSRAWSTTSNPSYNTIHSIAWTRCTLWRPLRELSVSSTCCMHQKCSQCATSSLLSLILFNIPIQHNLYAYSYRQWLIYVPASTDISVQYCRK